LYLQFVHDLLGRAQAPQEHQGARAGLQGAEAIWDNFTVTREDTREEYGESRLVTFGILNGEVVVLVHVDRDEDMHVISLRRAEKYEARYYFEAAEDYFRKGR